MCHHSYSFVTCRGTDCPISSDDYTQSMQQSHQHKFECSLKAIELLIEQRNFGGLFERISQVLFVSLDFLSCILSVQPRQPDFLEFFSCFIIIDLMHTFIDLDMQANLSLKDASSNSKTWATANVTHMIGLLSTFPHSVTLTRGR